MSQGTNLVCPDCGNWTGLKEIGTVITLQPVRITREVNGNLFYEYENWTDCDAPEATGIQCNECGWEYEGADYPDQLVSEVNCE